jgi:hypothetical protein
LRTDAEGVSLDWRRRERAGGRRRTRGRTEQPNVSNNQHESIMFPSIKKPLCLFAATLSLAFAVAAQGGLPGGILGGTSGTMSSGGIGATPPVLPSVQTKSFEYTRAIGNSWLGGSVGLFANMVRQKQGGYELGAANVELSGTARVLKYSREVAEIVGTASNVMNNGVQTRSGYYRVEVLGVSVTNNFTNSSTFGYAASNFNLFPGNGVSASVPVGPVSITLAGNAGCAFSRSFNWLLPAATATVGINANAAAHAFANASVSVGVWGFNAGVGIQGKILEQTLGVNLSASAVWGLSGGATYTLRAISLQLYAQVTAFWQTWTNTLCTWSSGLITLSL